MPRVCGPSKLVSPLLAAQIDAPRSYISILFANTCLKRVILPLKTKTKELEEKNPLDMKYLIDETANVSY